MSIFDWNSTLLLHYRSEDKRYFLNVKLFPKKPARILKTTLETIKSVLDRMMMTRASLKGRSDTSEAMDIDFQQKRREVSELYRHSKMYCYLYSIF